jgi:branched-chain amino acid aminotransferase
MKAKPTRYIWMNGSLVTWGDVKVNSITDTLHHGAGAFEEIRVYKTEQGPAIFRLEEHVERLLYSAHIIHMEVPFTAREIFDATAQVVWENGLEQGHIQPVAYYGCGTTRINPAKAPVDIAITCWPRRTDLPYQAVNVKISSPCIQICPTSTVCMFLYSEDVVAKEPGENIFFIKNNRVFTPQLEPIRAEIARRTVMRIFKDQGIAVSERVVPISEALDADEAFFTGTTAEVIPVRSINDTVIGDGSVGPITERIKESYLDIVYGRNKEYDYLLTYV